MNTTGNTLSTNLISTGNALSKKIDDLSGVSVLTYGDQLILGNKTFNGNTIINNLIVTGTETIVNTTQLNVANPYLLLNISGGASDGGIFFVTGSGLTGVNDSGPIIGFDHSNKFKFGISTRNSDLSPLPDIASVQDIVAYSGVADNKFATITNLNSTGNTLSTNINTVASNLITTGNTLSTNINTLTTNLNTTGNDLQTQINTLSNKVVYTTGNQTISGTKIFEDYLNINTLNSNNFRLNLAGDKDENAGMQIDSYGINPPQILMRRTRGSVTTPSGVLKDDVLFNLQARGYVSGLNDYSTNSRAAIRLIAAEDWVGQTGYTGQGTYISFRATNIGNSTAIEKVSINSSGLNILDGNIYISGNQVLTGVLPSAQIDIVYTTGNQSISGIKTFKNNIEVEQTGIFNNLDLSNISEFTFSGTDINLINGDVNFSGLDLVSISGTDISIISGNISLTNRPTVNGTGILLSGEGGATSIENVVYTTGNQNINGIKDFGSRPTVNNTGVLLIGETAPPKSGFFILNFGHTSDQPTVSSHNYFAANSLGFNGTNANRRYIQVLEKGTAIKASWQHIAGTTLPSPALNSTGYFINVTTNTLGVINVSILSNSTNIPNNFTGTITPQVPFNVGDFVVCSLFTPTFTGIPVGVRDTVNVYCYN